MTGVDLTSVAELMPLGFLAQGDSGNWLEATLNGLPTALILWGGLLVLTLAFVVLMRTRWAQSRPVACCVALSIFAHILLFSYAYGTRLIMAVPVSENVESIPIELVDEPQPAEPNPEEEADTSAAPWDELVGEEGLRPETSSPPAMTEPDVQVPTERELAQAPAEIQPSNTRLVARTPQSEPQRPPQEVLTPLPFERATFPSSAASLLRPKVDVASVQTEPNLTEATAWQHPSSLLSQPPAPSAPQLGTAAGDVSFDPALQKLAEALTQTTDPEAFAGPDQLVPSRITRNADAYTPTPQREKPSSPPSTATPPATTTPASQVASSNASAAHGAALVDQLIAQPRTRLGDGRAVPEPFRLRRADHRLDIALARGGTAQTEAAVKAGLEWLARNQREDGSWDADHHGAGSETSVLGHERGGAGAEADMGVTGLAILAFLSAGHTHQEGDYRKVVSNGLSYLVSQQASDGNLHGHARLFARMYCHGMALFALSEAYGMTGDHALREAVQAGLRYTVDAQHPSSGGWRYQPGDQGDMSQFGWQVMAIKSAALAGVTTPVRTQHSMHQFLNSCCRGDFGGLASYRPHEKISPTMTAEALVCRLLLENAPSMALIREAQGAVAAGTHTDGLTSSVDQASSTPSSGGDAPLELPETAATQKQLNLYFLYYGTLAMFLAQDESWQTWNQHLQNELLPAQCQTGTQSGSWQPDTVWGGYGGRVYSTAMATLCLEVYYRYLPLYQTGPDDAPTAETARGPLQDFRLPR